MFEDSLEILEVTVLIHAEIVRMPPKVEDLAALRGMGHGVLYSSHAERLKEGKRTYPRAEEAARGYVHGEVGGPHGSWVRMVAAYVHVVIEEAKRTDEERLLLVPPRTVEEVVLRAAVRGDAMLGADQERLGAHLVSWEDDGARPDAVKRAYARVRVEAVKSQTAKALARLRADSALAGYGARTGDE